jgi:membrane-bound metal-dependent hydrolase YbcI (DUF457 family)
MADFRTHMTVSTLAGIAYGVAGYQSGLPWETCAVGAGLCSVSGMLPDLDSESGIPIREATSFSSAVVPMLMADRLQRMGLGHETMVLVSVGIYLLIRFGIAEFFRRFTVHRGMWHSIPAAVSVGMVAFLICASEDFGIRIYKTAAVVVGFLSHLLLDEIWSIEFRRGSYQFKNSFGSALKFWGQDRLANAITYLKVFILSAMVYNDEGLMQRYGYRHQDVPHTAREFFQSLRSKSQEWLQR